LYRQLNKKGYPITDALFFEVNHANFAPAGDRPAAIYNLPEFISADKKRKTNRKNRKNGALRTMWVAFAGTGSNSEKSALFLYYRAS